MRFRVRCTLASGALCRLGACRHERSLRDVRTRAFRETVIRQVPHHQHDLCEASCRGARVLHRCRSALVVVFA